MTEPTAEDRARDLVADLAWITGDEVCVHPRAEAVAAAGLRRAQAAEAWKAWVHAWLDAAGVPHDPDPEHTVASGCRISGRLRHLLRRALAAEAEVERLCALLPAQPPTPQYPVVPDLEK